MKELPLVPGPPLLGQALALTRGELHLVFEAWSAEHGPRCRFRLPGREAVLVSDLDMVIGVLKRRPQGFRRLRAIESTLDELGIRGIFSAEGEEWKRQSRLVKAAFSRRSIDAAFDVLRTTTDRLLRVWSGKTDFFDARPALMCFTADVTTLLAFGYDLNTIERESPLQEQVQLLFETIGRRVAAPFPHWRVWRTARDRAALEALRAIRDLVDEVVRSGGHMSQLTLLSGMIEARDREEFGDEEIFGNVMTMIFAGEDTTANTTAWMLDATARDPRLATRIREEARAALGDELPRDLATLARLPFADAVFREVLRLRSPAPYILLEALEDVTVEGVSLPKGTLVIPLTRAVGMNEAHFSEPTRFYPERWLGEHAPGWRHDPRAQLAFGAGPRACPGAQLAAIESQVLVSAVCRRFELEVADTKRFPEEVSDFVMHPREVPLRVSPCPVSIERTSPQ